MRIFEVAEWMKHMYELKKSGHGKWALDLEFVLKKEIGIYRLYTAYNWNFPRKNDSVTWMTPRKFSTFYEKAFKNWF